MSTDISLSRIYQGRVTALELQTTTETISPKGKVTATKAWAPSLKEAALLPLLGDFHALFQDAVNYYLVALIGMATDESTPAGKVRAQIVTGGDASVWDRFRRRGEWRPGLRDSVAKHLGFAPGSNPDFAAVVVKIFEGNPTPPEVRNAALNQLVADCKGDGAIQQNGRTYWPLLCDPGSEANSPADPLVIRREFHQQLMPVVIHDPATRHTSAELREFDIYSVAKPAKEGGKPVKMSAAKAAGLFEAAIKNCFASDEPTSKRLRGLAEKTDWTNRIPDYTGGSVNKEALLRRFHAWVIFEYLEKSEATLAKLREVFPVPKKLERPAPPAASGDPITELRGERGFAFPAFTRQIRLDWGSNDFDICAFKEALKALNQISAKGEERAKSREKLESVQSYQKSPEARWKDDADSDATPPPKLAGDPRIQQLEALLTGDLAATYEATEGESVAYGLRPRTIRGFEQLAKRWNAIAAKHSGEAQSLPPLLKKALVELQTEEPDTIGSVVLFEALLKPENHVIWKTPDAETMARWHRDAGIPADAAFAENPLAALTDHRERSREIEELRRPIRLTPADPVFSPRQILLTEIGPKQPHEKMPVDGSLKLTAAIAIKSPAGAWERKAVRLTYAAPRLLRDGLRQPGEAGLDKVRWSQPMLTALGLGDTAPQDFAACAVHLMPAIRDGALAGLLLNFPLTLEIAPIVQKLGTASRWPKSMFGLGSDFEPAWLHWPASLDLKKHPEAWWRSTKPFRILAEDLGTRDAGAFALLEVFPLKADAPAPTHARFLGVIENTAWYAKRAAIGLHRLPGEDAEVIRDGKRVEEYSGEKGRIATREESENAREFARCIGADETRLARLLGRDLAETRRLSFPEQNDRLLRAFRQAQGRLARMQSWSALNAKELKAARRARILEEIAETDLLDDELKSGFKTAPDKACAELIRRAELLRQTLTAKLPELADRILPLLDRHWAWEPPPETSANPNARTHLLHPGRARDARAPRPCIYGQRGLSLERIDQLENLRHRAQSLNRALTHTLGTQAAFGRGTRGDELPDPCPDILRKLENMKENRVKQTAHLILADALGVRLKAHSDESRRARETRDIHGEYEKIQGRTPVDWIVLEDLNRYLADQGRSRTENTRLMQWSHRAIVERVRQLAEPFGIPVLTTAAAYTSRFCSRTGAPGFRAMALHPGHRQEFPWNKDFAKLAAHTAGITPVKDADEVARLKRVETLFSQLDELNRDELARRDAANKSGESFRARWRTLLAPTGGGPLFIALSAKASPGKPVQADINAATNIGLRALAAPDTAAVHVRIRAQRDGAGAQKNRPKRGGATDAPPLAGHIARRGNKREEARWKAIPDLAIRFTDAETKPPSEAYLNFFHDPGRLAEFERARLGDLPLATGKALWHAVKTSAWTACEILNRQTIADADTSDVTY